MEISFKGIKCDEATCDYRDDSVGYQDYPNLLNAPCPKCGANLLTQEDFDTAKQLHELGEVFKGVDPKLLYSIMQSLNPSEEVEQNVQNIGEKYGIEDLKPDDLLNISLDTHKGIRIVDVKRVDK